MVRPAIRFVAEPDKKGEWYVCLQWSSAAIKGPMSEAAAEKIAAEFTAKEIIREFFEWALEEWAETHRDKERRRDTHEQEEQRKFFEELLEEDKRIQALINEIVDRILKAEQEEDEDQEDGTGPSMGM